MILGQLQTSPAEGAWEPADIAPCGRSLDSSQAECITPPRAQSTAGEKQLESRAAASRWTFHSTLYSVLLQATHSFIHSFIPSANITQVADPVPGDRETVGSRTPTSQSLQTQWHRSQRLGGLVTHFQGRGMKMKPNRDFRNVHPLEPWDPLGGCCEVKPTCIIICPFHR